MCYNDIMVTIVASRLHFFSHPAAVRICLLLFRFGPRKHLEFLRHPVKSGSRLHVPEKDQ